MARISLTPEAARAVLAKLRAAGMGLDVQAYDCFDGHDSQSRMMGDFERRAGEVRELIVRYQELLAHDVTALKAVCTSIVLTDMRHGLALEATAERGASRGHKGVRG